MVAARRVSLSSDNSYCILQLSMMKGQIEEQLKSKDAAREAYNLGVRHFTVVRTKMLQGRPTT